VVKARHMIGTNGPRPLDLIVLDVGKADNRNQLMMATRSREEAVAPRLRTISGAVQGVASVALVAAVAVDLWLWSILWLERRDGRVYLCYACASAEIPVAILWILRVFLARTKGKGESTLAFHLTLHLRLEPVGPLVRHGLMR
jgi:hypothetical protein